MSKEYVYSDYTYNSRNPLVRFSHRKRFLTALNFILKENFKNLLDYGAGDGHFLKEVSKLEDKLNAESHTASNENWKPADPANIPAANRPGEKHDGNARANAAGNADARRAWPPADVL